MVAGIIITPTRSSAAATKSFRSISTSRVVPRRLKRCFTAYCCYKGRFAVPVPSNVDSISIENIATRWQRLASRIGGSDPAVWPLQPSFEMTHRCALKASTEYQNDERPYRAPEKETPCDPMPTGNGHAALRYKPAD